jgi:hypothetical protein
VSVNSAIRGLDSGLSSLKPIATSSRPPLDRNTPLYTLWRLDYCYMYVPEEEIPSTERAVASLKFLTTSVERSTFWLNKTPIIHNHHIISLDCTQKERSTYFKYFLYCIA